MQDNKQSALKAYVNIVCIMDSSLTDYHTPPQFIRITSKGDIYHHYRSEGQVLATSIAIGSLRQFNKHKTSPSTPNKIHSIATRQKHHGNPIKNQPPNKIQKKIMKSN